MTTVCIITPDNPDNEGVRLSIKEKEVAISIQDILVAFKKTGLIGGLKATVSVASTLLFGKNKPIHENVKIQDVLAEKKLK